MQNDFLSCDATLTVGLMSGTSLDGVDAVLMRFSDDGAPELIAEAALPYPADVREAVLALQAVDSNELDRAARLGNTLAGLYAEAVAAVLKTAGVAREQVAAIGCHGQTIRHAPEKGYTLQIGNLASLAELTGIDVAGDFRSRDVAAGGHGAPLVPAFHDALFGHPLESRAIVNVGGIANLTRLAPGEAVIGFDTGPGNMLMDAWTRRHLGQAFDADGAWAASGTPHAGLLAAMLAEPYFAAPPPKSTGRDLFDLPWLALHLAAFADIAPADVQATLLELTVESIAEALGRHTPGVAAVCVCGGGARNGRLMHRLAECLPHARLELTDVLGLPSQQVEAAAFAWLAWRLLRRDSGNLPEVTGAAGLRVLGALYPR
ncbi:anhydro-N-acetylmuramic acid kinase [Crenobacter cavernae]|uniref:Anhydro-N-acetylmuramic acid kinase n=1 Tax=Crenobacter cavernae TaxID=2290923 RepID=A0A345Y8N7_9NEIS|nr:anhydro-N-acetylmuramic acid kinase [Crenobacter cavernae]AXK40289.1 anhydro-N-acetylmuramic acid kinase [Crenobacter cavernae]